MTHPGDAAAVAVLVARQPGLRVQYCGKVHHAKHGQVRPEEDLEGRGAGRQPAEHARLRPFLPLDQFAQHLRPARLFEVLPLRDLAVLDAGLQRIEARYTLSLQQTAGALQVAQKSVPIKHHRSSQRAWTREFEQMDSPERLPHVAPGCRAGAHVDDAGQLDGEGDADEQARQHDVACIPQAANDDTHVKRRFSRGREALPI